MRQLKVHVAHNAMDYTEIRVRGASRKPKISLRRADDEAASVSPDMEMQRAAVAGCWRCIFRNLLFGVEYMVFVSAPGATEDDDCCTVSFRTLDPRGLGKA